MPSSESPRASSPQSFAESDGTLHLELVDALAQSAFVVAAVLTRIGAENDLSLTQLRVFGILRDHRPRMADLAARLGLEKSTMSGLVSRAEKRGLMRREPSETDGRSVVVTLTEKGAALAERVYSEVTATLRPLLDVLDPSDQRTLGWLLDTMLDGPQP